MAYKLVCFDFDHTLTKKVSAAEHVAPYLGCAADMAKAEREFRDGHLTTRQFTDRFAYRFKGHAKADVARHMQRIDLVSDIPECVGWLKSRGVRVVINTVGFSDLLVSIPDLRGFDNVSGVNLITRDGHYTGEAANYFTLEDKIAFAGEEVKMVGGTLDDVIAIGDGLSDVPLFNCVGSSIAFNAPADVAEMADAAATGTSCTALMTVLKAFLKEDAA